MASNQRKRLKWILYYQKFGNAGKACLKCSISRPALRKWFRYYQQYGIEGLKDKSRRPFNSPTQKITASTEKVCAEYDPKKKRFRLPNYKLDLEMCKLK